MFYNKTLLSLICTSMQNLMRKNVLLKKHPWEITGYSLWCYLWLYLRYRYVYFRQITIKDIVGVIQIDLASNVNGSLVVEHSFRVWKVPDSIPGRVKSQSIELF